MLSFFKVNAVYQIFSLLILLILIRMPVYLVGLPQLIPELQWMLVGEQINKGFVMYSEIWDNTAPLSTLVYAGLDGLFGRSQSVYQIVALLLTYFQAVYFNVMVNNRDLFVKRNYLPGLFYLLFMNISFDCCTLSPVLMATTFVLLSLGTLVKQMNRLQATDEVFEIGFFIGLATLFYPPAGVFILWATSSLLFFSGTTLRQHSLSIFGFLFPLLLTALFFYLNGTYDAFSRNFISSVLQLRQYDLNDFRSLLATLLLPFTFGVLGFLRLVNAVGFNNYQIRCQQVMMIWAIAGVVSIGLMPFLAPMQFIIFVPAIAFFTVSFFNNTKRAWLAELTCLALFSAVLLIHYQAVYFKGVETFVQLKNLKLKEEPDIKLSNKKILVFGDGMEEYKNNFAATPYINWSLAKYELENLDNYNNVINILSNFEKDYPEVIIDKVNLTPKLFKRIPVLARKYHAVGNGVYELN
ncbi:MULTISPECIES: hypothetical protein [unclassified Arcicella]|uniref:hypothetical protein n=1 Tax=unclassified Arcicella TaxID=2644986 RepID=UPI00286447B0|nr:MULTISPECIES: hypothetical protein [unclassified Arcicella]MDR6563496.1 hypothetical protein [Arcicella sp. BE51]MDR6813392.1 hypothetical protein [Arcicella sp. BE140]MDR6824705.1 hypothetical protein [Arcicella sp. BE139]